MRLPQKLYIFTISSFFLLCTAHTACVFAVSAEYDQIWEKRNAARRLAVVERSVQHYARAVALYKAGDFQKAHIALKDALKVEPRFAEALWLRGVLYEQTGDLEKASQFKQKSDTVANELIMPVLAEKEYLQKNLERLKALYNPPTLYNKIIFILLFSFGVTVVFFILVSSNFFIIFAMRIRQIMRFRLFSKQEQQPTLITERFPGDEPDVKIPWFTYVIAYTLCFVFSFGVVLLFDFDSRLETIGYGLFGGFIMAILVYHIFFSDLEFEGPQKFGRFR
jgi:tetratricopeptide (TPR) repeat protein